MPKIASNSGMNDQLHAMLARIFASCDQDEIKIGLLPLCARLARQFGTGDEAQFEQRVLPFCTEYILQIPALIDLLKITGRDLRLEDLIDTYLTLSSSYLLSACEEIEQNETHKGLEQFLILLQGAYIFGRMLEELDDKVEIFIGVPISHLNMMDANLIVHEIIGESFANRLDKVVISLVKQSQVSKGVIEAGLDKVQVDSAKKEHKSLSGRPVINFAESHGLDLLSGLL